MSNERTVVIRGTVLSVGKPFDFLDDKGERVFGCKLFFVATDDINNKYFDEETECVGYVPQEVKMEPEFYDVVKTIGLPCVADLTYGLTFKTSGVKSTLKGVEFIRPDLEKTKK